MSRLIDRLIAADCPPFRVAELYRSDKSKETLGRVAEKGVPGAGAALGLTERELGAMVLAHQDPVGTRRMSPSELTGIPVLVADNVADYCRAVTVPKEGLYGLVTTVAPPFGRFFVECCPSSAVTYGITPLHSWGFLCGAADLCDKEWRRQVPDRRLLPVLAAFSDGGISDVPAELADVAVRWVLQMVTFLEPRKGRPMGPVSEHSFLLDDQGCLIGLPGGEVASIAGLVSLSATLTDNFESGILSLLDAQIIPALFAISLTHCKNVRMSRVEPPAALSRKAARNGGRPLVRYQVLEIGAMRQILDSEGSARTKGLGHALHICRGHFKVFTPEAPLFGKHVGSYFWHDVARGSPRRGVVTTDYRVVVGEE